MSGFSFVTHAENVKSEQRLKKKCFFCGVAPPHFCGTGAMAIRLTTSAGCFSCPEGSGWMEYSCTSFSVKMNRGAAPVKINNYLVKFLTVSKRQLQSWR